jgi:hypothetical protein
VDKDPAAAPAYQQRLAATEGEAVIHIKHESKNKRTVLTAHTLDAQSAKGPLLC